MNDMESKVQALPIPGDYFHGIPHLPPPAPREIVLFSRTSGSSLNLYKRPYFHHRYIFITSLKGRGRIMLDSRMIDLDPGCSILIFPYQNHYFHLDEGEEFTWLFIGFELDETPLLTPLNYTPRKTGGKILQQLEHIIDLYSADSTAPAEEAQISHILGSLLCQTAGRSRSVSGEDEKVLLSEDARFIREVQNYVHDRLKEPLTVGCMARDFGLSESGLRKRFRTIMGFSPALYIRQIKLTRAASLLANSRLSVTEISRKCGFDSLYSFSRTFRKGLGKSPLQYRRQFLSE